MRCRQDLSYEISSHFGTSTATRGKYTATTASPSRSGSSSEPAGVGFLLTSPPEVVGGPAGGSSGAWSTTSCAVSGRAVGSWLLENCSDRPRGSFTRSPATIFDVPYSSTDGHSSRSSALAAMPPASLASSSRCSARDTGWNALNAGFARRQRPVLATVPSANASSALHTPSTKSACDTLWISTSTGLGSGSLACMAAGVGLRGSTHARAHDWSALPSCRARHLSSTYSSGSGGGVRVDRRGIARCFVPS